MSTQNLNNAKEIMIALEDNMFSSAVDGLVSLISDISGNLNNRLKDIKYYFQGLPEDPQKFFDDLNYLEEKIDSLRYIDYKDNYVPVPENYTGKPYIEYTKVLEEDVKSIRPKIKPLFKDYTVLLSSIINNGSDGVILKDYQTLYKTTSEDRKKLDDSLKEFFGNEKTTVLKISKLINSFDDLKKLMKAQRDLLGSINVNELLELNTDVQNLNSLFDNLIENVKDNKIVINKADVLDIGQGAYEIAQYLESISLVYYNVNVLINRIKDMVVTILKI